MQKHTQTHTHTRSIHINIIEFYKAKLSDSKNRFNCQDILTAIKKLDKAGKLSNAAVSSDELNRLPKFQPEELMPFSVVERLLEGVCYSRNSG